jgi:hypothetical protein
MVRILSEKMIENINLAILANGALGWVVANPGSPLKPPNSTLHFYFEFTVYFVQG